MNRGCAIFLALALQGPLSAAAAAQAVVEHAVITAGSTGAAAAGGKGVGKSIGGVFDKMKTVLDQAGKPAVSAPGQSAVIHSTAPSGDSPKPSTACVEDPGKVTVGLAYDEVLTRCGVPSLKTNTGAGGLLLWFTAKGKETLVTVAAGKVSAIATQQQKANQGIVVVQ